MKNEDLNLLVEDRLEVLHAAIIFAGGRSSTEHLGNMKLKEFLERILPNDIDIDVLFHGIPIIHHTLPRSKSL